MAAGGVARDSLGCRAVDAVAEASDSPKAAYSGASCVSHVYDFAGWGIGCAKWLFA